MTVKTCSKCGEDKSLDSFYKLKGSRDGLRPDCIQCHSKMKAEYHQRNKEKVNKKCREYHWANRDRLLEDMRERSANWWAENKDRLSVKERRKEAYNRYRTAKLNAVPEWYDKEEVAYIYSIAKEKGLEVDHIVPLNSDYVCGLHVQDNLRCIPKKLNMKKSNNYWSNM